MVLNNYEKTFKDLDNVHILEPNNAFTLKTCGTLKYLLHDYQGVALENIHKTHVLDPNNASTWRNLEHVKRMLVDYQEALEDLEIHVFIYMPPPLFYKYICGIR
jgi:tetratricopeptide (TPR) repeat protein